MSINGIGLYLLYLYNQNYSYSSLNTARSALSFFLSHKLDLGSNDHLSRLFKFFYRKRPSLPRYLVTWDINKLLKFLQSWHPIHELSLHQLTLKTVTLVALCSSDRAATLEAINIDHSEFEDDAILFPIYSVLKGHRKNRPIRVVKCMKIDDPSLDVCSYVAGYLQRTHKFRLRAVNRKQVKPTQLFLSYYTGKPIKKATIARYILTTMEFAGIDTSCFKAHSARNIIPSLMKRKGCSPEVILNQGDWKSCSTFSKHYDKESEDSSAGRLIQNILGKRRN